MKSDLEKISETLRQGIQSAECIAGGKSGARSYKVISSNGTWVAKLFPEKPRMEEWYSLVRSLDQPQLVCARFSKTVGDGEVCTAAEWIEGECLEDHLLAHPETSFDYGRQAAGLLRILHGKHLDETMLGIPYHEILKNRIRTTIDQIDRCDISLPHFENFRSFLMTAVDDLKWGPVTLIHNDIRPANFMISKDRLFLIDFENGGIGESVQDFASLMTTASAAFYPFTLGFFTEYMQNGLTGDFIPKSLLYSVLHVLRDAAALKQDSASLKHIQRNCNLLYCLYEEYL